MKTETEQQRIERLKRLEKKCLGLMSGQYGLDKNLQIVPLEEVPTAVVVPTSFIDRAQLKADAIVEGIWVKLAKSALSPNKLIVIGWMGCKRCYLNVPKDEALARFAQAEELNLEEVQRWAAADDGWYKEFQFDSEFSAYDASEL